MEILIIIIIILYIIYLLYRYNSERKFRKNIRVGQRCRVYIEEDKEIGEIIRIYKNNEVAVLLYDSGYVVTININLIYPI